MKLVLTADDGTVSEFFDQAHVNAAVDAAVANHAATHGLVKDVIVENEDGTSETLSAPDAEEAAETPEEEAAEGTV